MLTNNTTYEIKNIDLASLVQSYGVELKKSGSRHVACCPFHLEKTGSFFVFSNNSYYCFGCNASGDAASFIMKITGCSFPESLEKLGIRKSKARYDQFEIKEFKENQIKNSLLKSFRAWESRHSSELGKLILSGYAKLSKIKNTDDLNKLSWIYRFVSMWEYRLDILCYGDDQEKYKLFREVR